MISISEPVAAVFTGPGEPVRLRTFPRPTLRPGEALVRVRMSTICGSDVHTYTGRRSAPVPTILGHEIVGIVEEVSEAEPAYDAQGVALNEDDRVVWSVAASCGSCFFCRCGIPQKCVRLVKYGHEALNEDRPLLGGLATHCHLVRGAAVLRAPDELPNEVLCPVSCATATMAAGFRAAGSVAGQCVLLQGAGMLGLTATAMARAFGAAHVIVTDLDPVRLALAERFGATRTALASEAEAVAEAVHQATDGRGADIALELSGAPSALDSGVELLRIGGVAVWLGAVFPAGPMGVAAERIVRKCLTIHGVHNYAPRDLIAAMDFLRREWRESPFGELVAATFALSEVERAFAAAAQGGVLRVAVVPDAFLA